MNLPIKNREIRVTVMSQRKTQKLDWQKLSLIWQKKCVWEVDFVSIWTANQIDQKRLLERLILSSDNSKQNQETALPSVTCVCWGPVLSWWQFEAARLGVIRKDELQGVKEEEETLGQQYKVIWNKRTDLWTGWQQSRADEPLCLQTQDGSKTNTAKIRCRHPWGSKQD